MQTPEPPLAPLQDIEFRNALGLFWGFLLCNGDTLHQQTEIWRRRTKCTIFSERVRYMLSPVRPSVCRLSVTLVHATQAVEIFGNISTAFSTLAILDIHEKFYGDRPREPLLRGS